MSVVKTLSFFFTKKSKKRSGFRIFVLLTEVLGSSSITLFTLSGSRGRSFEDKVCLLPAAKFRVTRWFPDSGFS